MVNQNGNRNIRDQVQGNVMVIGIRAMAIEEKESYLRAVKWKVPGLGIQSQIHH